MERRITTRDIAKALNCHPSTVSLALRNDPRLPAKTRALVQRTARKLGYRPDPMVQALAAYRTAIKPPSDHGTIAWLTNEAQLQIGPSYAFKRYFEGAQERAVALGYRLEEFALRAPGMSPRRMVQILQTRNINGVIVAPQPPGRIRSRIRLDWTSFSAVAISFSLGWPPLHLVTNHHLSTVQKAYRKLVSFGYRRIGICVDRVVNGRCNGGFLGGYFSEAARWPDHQIPPYVYDAWTPSSLRAWFRAYKPQALIVHDSVFLENARECLKVRVPDDVGMVCLHGTSKGYACVDQNNREIGIAAVDLIVSMLHRNERGVPEVPRHVLIGSTWRNGSSVRRVNVPATAPRRRKIAS